jgi:NAD(P)-dependent dehydrogenase (short-subunit alcohol dehydrogenase family)
MTPRPDGSPISLITGANQGIGLSTARRLVRSGHHVLLSARDHDRGTAAAEGIGARFVQLDVTSDESVAHAADRVRLEYGRLDVLINNAGITGPLRETGDYTASDMGAVLSVNVVGYVRVIHAFLPLLRQSPDPRVINVSSGLGSFGLALDPDRSESRAPTPLYAASKAAINMLTLRYAQSLPDIRVCSADPGMTATELSGGRGQPVEAGTDAIIALATDADAGSGVFRDRYGVLPW